MCVVVVDEVAQCKEREILVLPTGRSMKRLFFVTVEDI